MSKYGVSLAIPRDKDLRFKLTEENIAEIRRLWNVGDTSYSAISRKFGIHCNTVRYYVDEEYRTKLMARNAKSRCQNTERYNASKQRRRDLVRGNVRVYTRNQMRALRAKAGAK